MSDAPNNRNNTSRPGDLDAELQRELDEALGGMSLEELMDTETAAPAGRATGKSAGGKAIRKGQVVSIQGDDIFVDLGGRSEGILPAAQFEDEPLPKIGDTIEVTIEGYDEDDGLMMLSRLGAVMAAAWETLEMGQIVEGRVTGMNKGGLELKVDSIRAFMPISQIEIFRVEDASTYLNQHLRCKVVEVDQANERLVVSRRALLEEEQAVKREELFKTLQEGAVVQGVVRSIMPYGAFVDIGGADGLLHIKDMSHARIKDPREVVREGLQLEVKVLTIDREARKIALGLKQVKADPWADVQSRFPEGEVVTGRVTKLMDFGAFVELGEGVEGLIPMGEMSFERRLKSAAEVLKEGDAVKVRVMSVDMARKRISLSLKRVGDDPWVGASARWPADSVVTGIVKRTTEFGAFIELTPGVEGMVHISELSDQRVRAVADVVKEGDTVSAKVIEVDEDRRRIALSIKALKASPDYTGEAPAETKPAAPAPKRKKPLKGGLE